MADSAVNTGKVLIQNASNFYAWAISSSLSNVTFKYVSDAQVAEKVSVMSKFADALKPVKGTMKIHADVGAGDSLVNVADTSCYCKSCLDETGSCNAGWRKETTRKTLSRFSQASEVTDNDENQKQVSNTGNLIKLDSLNVGDFVAAKYGDRWYVGKILEIE